MTGSGARNAECDGNLDAEFVIVGIAENRRKTRRVAEDRIDGRYDFVGRLQK
jgi:hypothetical protein